MDPDEHYRIARRQLNLDESADHEAARQLAQALEDRDVIDPGSLRETFEGETVVVLGPKPGGAEGLDPAQPIVAAGSAVRQALSAGIQPVLVVSDLDGSDMGHEMFSRAGVPIAVHAHGDNKHVIDRMLPELKGPVYGTCQTEPPRDTAVQLHRFGGFTDGDRACFVAEALGATRLELHGWDLDEPMDGGEDKEVKLAIARRLLEDVEIPLTFVEPDEPKGKTLEDLVDDDTERLSLDIDERDPGTR